MARTRHQPEGRPPSLPPERAIPILEALIAEGEQIKHEDRKAPRVTTWQRKCESALAEAFGSAHENLPEFRGRFVDSYWGPGSSEADERQRFLKRVEDSVAVLQGAVANLRWMLPDSAQIFLPAGSEHDAYVEIREIIRRVTREILIVDTYVDQTLWNLLTNVGVGVSIRILTENMKGDFALEGKRFVSQHGRKVDVRVTPSYHDRFIVVDGQERWHLGASIKDAGKKGFMMSQLLQPTILSLVKTDIESEWSKSRVVSL